MDFSEYYVAYFDVLGYKEAFKKSKDISAQLIKSIGSSIVLMKAILSIINTPPMNQLKRILKLNTRFFQTIFLFVIRERQIHYLQFL